MTALAALGAAGLTPGQIDAIVVSHLHGDHLGGVPLVLLDAALRPRSRPLTIAGPADTRQRVQAALRLFGWTSVNVDAANFVELRPRQTAEIAGCEVTAFEVEHDPSTSPTGIRLQVDGVTIGFAGDAGWSDSLTEIANGVDLFICAVWSFDVADPTFIDLQTLLCHLDDLRCKRLILTHLGPTMLSRLAEVPLEVATNGLLISLD